MSVTPALTMTDTFREPSGLSSCSPNRLGYSFCPFFLVQIQELGPLLGGSDSPSRLIWTSSRSASRSNFSLEDFQHSGGREPYSSSKYALDLLSVALNRHFSQRVRPVWGTWACRAAPSERSHDCLLTTLA